MRNIFTHWESVINFTRNDIVFENKNKRYGAYVIRKYYPERLRNAFLYAVSGMSLLFAISLFLQTTDKVKSKFKPSDEHIIYLTPITPDKQVSLPPSKPEPILQPKPETVRFTIVDRLENVTPDAPPDITNNSTNTIDATSTGSDIPSDVISAGTGVDILTPAPEPGIVAQEMPQFIGGDSMLDKFLHDNIRYPPVARDNDIQGTVYIAFVVDKNGKIKDAKIVRGIGGGCEEEALRVVRLMPDWKAGRNNGYPVAVYFTLPVNFELR